MKLIFSKSKKQIKKKAGIFEYIHDILEHKILILTINFKVMIYIMKSIILSQLLAKSKSPRTPYTQGSGVAVGLTVSRTVA